MPSEAGRSFWIDTAALLTFVAVQILLSGRWPGAVDSAVLLGFIAIYWFALSEWIDRWVAPGSLSAVWAEQAASGGESGGE